MKNNDYSVGYGKPPPHTRFKAGQSGNPKGRHKGSRNLAADVARELAEMLVVTEGGRQRRISKQQAVIKALVANSIKGDVRASTALLRLMPEVERANKTTVEKTVVTALDEDILHAFRKQILQEERLNEKDGGSSHE